ncbi:hypothetical protein [Natronorubrum sp. DTA28]|uniref:hypothetical protein n=1 Tax=Natronorubrum sp. DTA28 TaxID=3447019 RepID=UPI003F85F539
MTDSKTGEGLIRGAVEYLANFIESYHKYITVTTGISAFILTILNLFFGMRFTPYGNTVTQAITSPAFLSIIGIILLMSHVTLQKQIHEMKWEIQTNKSAAGESFGDGPKEKMTDGGSTRSRPRDSKGRFKSKDSGGSDLLLLILGGIGGAIIATEFMGVDPLVGAILGILLVLILDP